MKLKLFSRQDCPLCEDAEEKLLSLGVDFEYIDIDDSEELMKKYNAHIPILMNSLNNTLNWPFEESSIIKFLGK